MVHVPLVYKYIMSRREKKAIRELRENIRKEKQQELNLLIEAERKKAENGEPATEIEEYYRDYSFTEDEIDILVRERIAAEKQELKKAGFFKEGKKRFAMSLVCGAVGGFLICSVVLMPLFHVMDIVSTATSVIDNSEATDSIVYKTLATTDKHIVKPYEECFVVQLYDSMALIDLMNTTTRIGGKIVFPNNTVLYSDDLTKDMITNTATLAMELTTQTPNTEKLRASLHNIIIHPVLFDVFADTIVIYLNEMEIPEVAEGDMIGELTNKIMVHYKNADKELLKNDVLAITDTLIVLAQNGIVTDLLAENADPEAILASRDKLTDLVASMTALSVFNPLVEGVFDLGMDLVLPNMGIPENNAGGYDYFTEQILVSFGTVKPMSPEDIENVIAFMKGASEYENIYAYITSVADQAKEFDKKVQEFQQQADELQANADYLSQNVPDSLNPEELMAYYQQIDELEAQAKGLRDKATELEETAKVLQESIEEKYEQIQPFIDYYVAWMYVQKPFMLVGEDDSKACLSMVIDGDLYMCNTDEISIDDLLEMINEMKDNKEDTDVVPLEEGSKSISETIDELLGDIPMKALLEKLKVSVNATDVEGRVSPLSDLINYLIQSAGLALHENSTIKFDNSWLNAKLAEYVTSENIFEASSALVNRMLAAAVDEESKKEFDYKGVTIDKITSSTHFGEEWTAEKKKADSKIIGEMIFIFIDLKDTGFELGSSDSGNLIDSMGDTLGIFGEVMDLMSDTTCLGELPSLMLEGLIKGNLLGSSIPSPVLQEIYPQNQGNEDFSYAEYMQGLSERIDELMKLKNEGGIVQ